MKLDEIQQSWNIDSKIDDMMIDLESLKIPNLHAKYLTYFNQEAGQLRMLETEYKKLYKLKWEYYNGKLSKNVLEDMNWEPFNLKILKQDINIYLDSDDELIRIKDKIEYQKIKIQFLDSIIKSLNNRGYLLKNVIDWRRFTQGTL